ncbi:MAG TPA: bifunctional aldolase/short-chain dehydrogenase [Thermoanaerobaculia bacterium]|nr:bifunctional aldolase/short-chain dehydrogenase [Thermoanaerobaculia bacterium]
MHSRWSDAEALALAAEHPTLDAEAAQCLYAARLLGAEPALALAGGGNVSVKVEAADAFGDRVSSLLVKGSGRNLADLGPADLVPLDLDRLARVLEREQADDLEMGRLLAACRLDPQGPAPSVETPVHAALPARHVIHCHADAVLALTNRADGEAAARKALGQKVAVVPYVSPGLDLARATRQALAREPRIYGMVWCHHGLVTWGPTARDAYQRTIELVSRAEAFLEREAFLHPASGSREQGTEPIPNPRLARERWRRLAPLLRGLLATPSGDPDRPWRRRILAAAGEAPLLGQLSRGGARQQLVTAPLTTDHLIRIGRLPLWLEGLPWDDEPALKESLAAAVAAFRAAEDAVHADHATPSPKWLAPREATSGGPRLLLIPGIGAVTAGPDARAARLALELARHTVEVKGWLRDAGVPYLGLADEHLFAMEVRPFQQAKLARAAEPLGGTVALLTGAAGAIGAGVARCLLEAGVHLALADLAGPRLAGLAEELGASFPGRVLAVEADVTDAASVAEAFAATAAEWGGVDLVVANAGLAHVAPLTKLDPAAFRRLAAVNTEGVLYTLAEAGRLFERQGTGGDVVLISTKNVPAPGASFGAYSATKAAAHQLARVASLELAALDVRVNLVAPDAVFGDAGRPSGLWQEVGPSRMQARGLDPAGLEDYYRQRNLLKARVTARHVGEAVLFFALRRTPTTGATLPVDGGLPEATPR